MLVKLHCSMIFYLTLNFFCIQILNFKGTLANLSEERFLISHIDSSHYIKKFGIYLPNASLTKFGTLMMQSQSISRV